jgi:hypothetical protein
LTLIPNGAPGHFSSDAQILYQHLETVFSDVLQKYKPNYSEAWFVTYSLGGQYAQDLLKIDDEKRVFNFQQFVMLNPPLDISYTIDKYDSINEPSEKQYRSFRDELIGLGVELLFVGKEDRAKFYKAHFPLNDSQSDTIIGGTFKDDLDKVLYVTSLVHPDRDQLFTSRLLGAKPNQETLQNEIRKISLNEYFAKFVLPMIPGENSGKISHDVVYSYSLKNNLQTLAADKRIKIVLSKNDPISTSRDIQLFSETFLDRALVFDVGGHCGMYWFPGFADDFKSFLGVK